MTTQGKTLSIDDFIRDVIAYSSNAVRIAALKEEQAGLVSANGELRKAIVPFFKANADKKWSALSKGIKAAIVAAGVSDVDGLLGVLKTSFEYRVLPTQQNADRFRKLENWVSWNGMIVPNTYGKVHTKEGAGQKAKPVESSTTQTVPASPVQETVNTQPQTTSKAVSVKPATPQKVETPVVPLHSNVSSSEEPLSAREHFGVLFTQLLKNETFRGEYCDILAMMLEVDKATLTRCMVQARDEIK